VLKTPRMESGLDREADGEGSTARATWMGGLEGQASSTLSLRSQLRTKGRHPWQMAQGRACGTERCPWHRDVPVAQVASKPEQPDSGQLPLLAVTLPRHARSLMLLLSASRASNRDGGSGGAGTWLSRAPRACDGGSGTPGLGSQLCCNALSDGGRSQRRAAIFPRANTLLGLTDTANFGIN